ncbi:MAG TPA: hypothetical protein VMJ70_04060 [Candidatus Sulfotelmatobacter sp.]|nr:hypothetical protein [Candidatus Sulfotelmatobacter sp.]
MKRSRPVRPKSRLAPRPAGRDAATRRRGARVPWLLGSLTLAVLAAFAAWRAMPGRREARPTGLPSVSASAALDSLQALDDQGRSYDLVPYARLLMSLAPQNSFEFHARFAAALQNAAIESRRQDGVLRPRTRSSVERIGFLRETLSELDRAEALAPDAERRGAVATTRAEVLGLWGFERESLLEFRRANRFHPLDQKALGEAAWVRAMLADPTQAIPSPANPVR